MSKLPFMSVVIICYNGEQTIGRAIESVLAQDYPQDRFEVIVVNDGSQDQTVKIVKQYPSVHLVDLVKNRGVSGARNAGLDAVRGQAGDIYVAFDDDCVAASNWLRTLAEGYAQDNPVGVCGRLVELQPLRGLARQYISTTGSGTPPVVRSHEAPKHPFIRLKGYLTAGLHALEEIEDPRVQVQELYGANGSFPVDVLRTVGGWSTAMSGIEDRDLSSRIHAAFPDRHFYAMKQARIMHDDVISLKQYLARPYRRGPVNLRYHQANNMKPPLFPFPIFMAIVLGMVAVTHPVYLPTLLLLIPQVMYFWWAYYAITQRKLSFVCFPYLQLAEETMVLAGILRGYTNRRKEVHVPH